MATDRISMEVGYLIVFKIVVYHTGVFDLNCQRQLLFLYKALASLFQDMFFFKQSRDGPRSIYCTDN